MQCILGEWRKLVPALAEEERRGVYNKVSLIFFYLWFTRLMTRRAAFGCDFHSKGNWGSEVGLCCWDKKRRAGCERAGGRTQLPKDLPLCSSHFFTDAFEPSWQPKLLSGRIRSNSKRSGMLCLKKTQPKTGLPQTLKAMRLTMCLRKRKRSPGQKALLKTYQCSGVCF